MTTQRGAAPKAPTEDRQPYAGFPNRVRRVPVPAPLLGSLLERIEDMDELKCVLRVVAMLSEKRGSPRFVGLRELQADRSLLAALSDDDPDNAPDRIGEALKEAVRNGLLAFAVVGSGAERQPIFGLNAESDRAALAKVAGESPPPDILDWAPPASGERPNIFEMYEQNVGLLNPMIADELREAEATYREDWIEEAFREAVAQNKRSWRYISRILERWEREGKGYGEPGRYNKKTARY